MIEDAEKGYGEVLGKGEANFGIPYGMRDCFIWTLIWAGVQETKREKRAC